MFEFYTTYSCGLAFIIEYAVGMNCKCQKFQWCTVHGRKPTNGKCIHLDTFINHYNGNG